ncbi:nickel-responsive transcriptional regulator NikR [Sphingomonas sp. IW22]|uniref:nickel-responsive transcriptional regulator NikR n=1 Tax=Sphingomonas sp. IW22 TaxID=3242489 RepID=UPI003521E908
MQRITVSIDTPLAHALDAMSDARGYASRSEAMRDLVREGPARWHAEVPEGEHCVANLSYIVDRRVRALPQRLAEMQHAHHDLVGVTTTMRLDHDHSMESLILKGSTAAVRAFADQVRAERGVRFGAINLLRVSRSDDHDGVGTHRHEGHDHLSPAG